MNSYLYRRTQALLERAHLQEWPTTYKSLVLCMATSEGLESGELVRLSPHWYNIGRYERECAEWEEIQVPMDTDPVIVGPKDSLIEREFGPGLIEEMMNREVASKLEEYKQAWASWRDWMSTNG